MKPKQQIAVSVVMTSYNRAHYIGQATDSILSQECSFPFEIIIGDDCSTDGTRELLQEYKTKYPETFVLNFQETNVGVGANWASSVKLARGRYIAFLDDDDYWCDNHRLQQMVEYMDAHAECGLIHTAYYAFDSQTGEKTLQIKKYLPKEIKGTDRIKYIFKYGMPNLFSTSMIRKSVMDEHVKLDDYIRLKFGLQDWPTVVLIAPYCEFAYLSEPSVMYRQEGGSISAPQTYEAVRRKCSREESMHKYICEQYPGVLRYDYEDWSRYTNQRLLSVAYKRSDYRQAKEFAKHCYPNNIQHYCACSYLSFHLYCLLKNLRGKCTSLMHRSV